ncbi:MAG: hypothetical protein KDE27_16900, partial [Planctomycetes bacterium]|nr:hypothetical protein [Planctomycetota bacterium]
VRVAADGTAVTIDDDDRDHECTAQDRAARNPIAQPDIAVSRIDARGVALGPAPDGADFDADLELRLLVAYFDRNHAFRTQPVAPAGDKPASVAFGLGSGMAQLRRARHAWREFVEAGYDVTAAVDLVALTAWWQRPALLRTLRAHSNGTAAVFARTDATALERALGVESLPASLRGDGRHGRAGLAYYRALWQSDRATDQPYILVHTGCEAIAPPGAERLAYDHPHYGLRQHAEAILFYTPCVALIGRAKVFYDEPRGFAATLAAGGSVGDAWRRYFAVEAAGSWQQAGGDIGRKRAYFWSLLGDFTLRLPPRRE